MEDSLCKQMSFATQKLEELSLLAHALCEESTDTGLVNPGGGKPNEATFEHHLITRSEAYEKRRGKQYQYPPFPTTTIGSFPQTPSIRKVRLQYKKGQISYSDYREAIAAEIGYSIGIQEGIGLDVFVHGEAERSDMVRIV